MNSAGARALIEALDEPALLVERGTVALANLRARNLLGRVEGKDVRLAIRHPQALEQMLANRPADLEVTGIAEFGATVASFDSPFVR